MYKYFKIFILFSLFISYIYAEELSKKYPSYAYVFNEFDIEKEYIYDNDFNEFVLKNETSLKIFYKRSLERGKDVLPTMKDLLVIDGVSDLFIYLSMVESGLSTSAISPKKAVGLWQFIPKTAQAYNLNVSYGYDERYDTQSATSAAIKYLNKLQTQFGKWYLAAMAYNCGEGCMQRAITKAGTDELTVLLDSDLGYLPFETREYIKKILLVAMIGENMTLDFDQNSDSLENGFIQVEISSKSNLKDIAKLINIKVELLEKLNENVLIEKREMPMKMYKIRIPISKVFSFYLKYKFKKEKKIFKTHYISHEVQLGETIESISKIYNANIEEILSVNKLTNENIMLDQLLVVPVDKSIFKDKYRDNIR
ncbi:MAG: transglycosylase SLT domain-containing protein [Sulfurovum sp.]|nr:transglycosylase SLT domain-containing protein [Sulfurovum sp.]